METVHYVDACCQRDVSFWYARDELVEHVPAAVFAVPLNTETVVKSCKSELLWL